MTLFNVNSFEPQNSQNSQNFFICFANAKQKTLAFILRFLRVLRLKAVDVAVDVQ